MSDINLEIAEALSKLGVDEGLVREGQRSFVCSQGHSHDHAFLGGTCAEKGCTDFVHQTITVVPHDFTKAEHLFEALKRLRYSVEWCPYKTNNEEGWNVEISDDFTILAVASEPELMRALHKALHEAVTKGAGKVTEKRWTELEALCPESSEWPSMHIDWEDGTDPRYIDFMEEAPTAVPELLAEVRRIQNKVRDAIGDLVSMDPGLATSEVRCALDHLREALEGVTE